MVIIGPKTSLGWNDIIQIDGGYILNGRDCPQWSNADELTALDVVVALFPGPARDAGTMHRPTKQRPAEKA
jgi:hypothetical protein